MNEPKSALAREGNGRDDPYGRHVFFKGLPDMGNGPVRVECSSCKTTRRMTLIDVAQAHFPLGLWVPLLRNAHWMRCPACDTHAWVRLTWARGGDA